MAVEVDDHRVVVEDKDYYYVVENHMMVDLMKMMVMVDDHMDEKVVEVYDQHLNQ